LKGAHVKKLGEELQLLGGVLKDIGSEIEILEKEKESDITEKDGTYKTYFDNRIRDHLKIKNVITPNFNDDESLTCMICLDLVIKPMDCLQCEKAFC